MTRAIAGPRGWTPGLIERREQRFADAASTPLTYDEGNRSVDAVLSRGSPVTRFYGSEVLRIDPKSVILDRIVAGGIPLLNSHAQNDINSVLGRVTRVWFEGGALMGRLQFNETRPGKNAQAMVGRGEIGAVSIGYAVREWEISDEDGNIIDPEVDRVRWDDNLRFVAISWELLETSLCAIAADSAASVRSLGGRADDIADIRTRMQVRARMAQRQRMHVAQQRVFGGNDD
jgi:phage head maturation protease